uniref:PDZ domain-containing protein n=1 Tax=Macrostomum lignano TaxID=282301 RepID=A0A1I8HW10_9PLAT
VSQPSLTEKTSASLQSPNGRLQPVAVQFGNANGEGEGENARLVLEQPDEQGCFQLRLTQSIDDRDVHVAGSPFCLQVNGHGGCGQGNGDGEGDGLNGFGVHSNDDQKPGGQGLTLTVGSQVWSSESGTDRRESQQDQKLDQVPLAPGDYTLLIKLSHSNGVRNCNYSTAITEKSNSMRFKLISLAGGVKQVAILGRGKRLRLPVWLGADLDVDEGGPSATVQDPAGQVRPCQLRRLADGRLAIAVSPLRPGRHRVQLLQGDSQTRRLSRFVDVDFSPRDLADASRVRVEIDGQGDEKFICYAGELFRLGVDVSEAGFGRLVASVSGPGRTRVDIEATADGRTDDGKAEKPLCWICCLATEPGDYRLSVTYGDDHVTGSPWQLKVLPAPPPPPPPPQQQPLPLSKATSVSSGLLRNRINQPNRFTVSLVASADRTADTASDLAVTIEGPSKARIDAEDGGREICWTASRPGVYRVGVAVDSVHVDGSPWLVELCEDVDEDGVLDNVQPMRSCRCPRACVVGLDDAPVGVGSTSSFRLMTCHRQVDVVSVCVDGPAKCPSLMAKWLDSGEDIGDCLACYEIVFSPEAAGVYKLSVQCGWGASCLRDVEAHRVVCTGCALRDASVGRVSVITVDARQADSVAAAAEQGLRAKLLGPSGLASGPVEIRKLSSAGVYSLSFTAAEVGSHRLVVTWAGCHVTGSPFQVRTVVYFAPALTKLSQLHGATVANHVAGSIADVADRPADCRLPFRRAASQKRHRQRLLMLLSSSWQHRTGTGVSLVQPLKLLSLPRLPSAASRRLLMSLPVDGLRLQPDNVANNLINLPQILEARSLFIDIVAARRRENRRQVERRHVQIVGVAWQQRQRRRLPAASLLTVACAAAAEQSVDVFLTDRPLQLVHPLETEGCCGCCGCFWLCRPYSPTGWLAGPPLLQHLLDAISIGVDSFNVAGASGGCRALSAKKVAAALRFRPAAKLSTVSRRAGSRPTKRCRQKKSSQTFPERPWLLLLLLFLLLLLLLQHRFGVEFRLGCNFLQVVSSEDAGSVCGKKCERQKKCDEENRQKKTVYLCLAAGLSQAAPRPEDVRYCGGSGGGGGGGFGGGLPCGDLVHQLTACLPSTVLSRPVLPSAVLLQTRAALQPCYADPCCPPPCWPSAVLSGPVLPPPCCPPPCCPLGPPVVLPPAVLSDPCGAPCSMCCYDCCELQRELLLALLLYGESST